MKFFIDDMGYLWRGNPRSHGNLHYSRFEGVGDCSTRYCGIWVSRSTNKPLSCEEISEDFAHRIVERYRSEAMEQTT